MLCASPRGDVTEATCECETIWELADIYLVEICEFVIGSSATCAVGRLPVVQRWPYIVTNLLLTLRHPPRGADFGLPNRAVPKTGQRVHAFERISTVLY